MIKVLNVVIDNHIGGIQNRILSVGKVLQDRGIQTIILAPRGEGEFANIANNSGFVTYQASIESPKLFTSLKNIILNILWIIKFPIGVIETTKIIKREAVNIVHVNGLLSLHTVIAAKITGTPFIWHLIGTIYPKILVNGLRPLFYSSNGIVLVTNNTRKYYLGNQFSSNLVRIIFEPVDIKHFKKGINFEENKKNLRLKYNIPLGPSVIGFVGNITPVKGLNIFLEVAKHQNSQPNDSTVFVIAGKTPRGHNNYLNKLQTFIINNNLKDKVVIISDFDDVRDIYKIIDIFMMTSLSEGTPLVILEAMAMELPVIAPDVGGISEQVSDGISGFIVPPKDIESTFNSLKVLLGNSELKESMGRMGRERVTSLFSLEICVNLHHNLYLEMSTHGK